MVVLVDDDRLLDPEAAERLADRLHVPLGVLTDVGLIERQVVGLLVDDLHAVLLWWIAR